MERKRETGPWRERERERRGERERERGQKPILVQSCFYYSQYSLLFKIACAYKIRPDMFPGAGRGSSI